MRLFVVAFLLVSGACYQPGAYGKFAGSSCAEDDESPCAGASDPPDTVADSCIAGASVGGGCPSPETRTCTIACTSDEDCAALAREPGRDALKCLPTCADGGPASVCGEP